MTMYDKYFSKQELEQMPMFKDQRARNDWEQLVAEVRQFMDSEVPPHDEHAKALARRWLTMLDRDTAGNHYLALKLHNMHENEPQAQRDTGITPELKRYIVRAIGEAKREIYARYLPPEVIERMARHQQTRAHEWIPLIEKVKAQMQQDPSPSAPAAQELARQWLDMTRDMIGDDPEMIARFRHASLSEPLLRIGRGMTDEMLDFVRQAMAANRAAG
jgi:hypothetical protein